MKRIILITLIFISYGSLLFIFENCSEEEKTKANESPSCNITNPANNATIELGTSVQISITASDPDGSIDNVKISIDNSNVTTLQSAPFNHNWDTEGVTEGQHTIKAVATDDGGLSATSQVTVNLTGNAPTVTTADIMEITETTATGGGNVTDDGGLEVTVRGVVWGEASGPSLDSNTGHTEDGSGTGEFTSNLTGLSANTTYYVKAYATNSQGTTYGEEKSFETSGSLATVLTGTILNITNESAECTAEVTDDGGEPVTKRGLVWGTMADPTLDNNEGFSDEGSGTGEFTGTITALTRVTEYWVRAYATNSAGTSYGDSKNFYTLPDLPTVTAGDVTEIKAHTAHASVEVTDDGGDNVTFVGFVWSTSPDPDISNNEGLVYDSSPDLNNLYDLFLTGLVENTTYYIRAYGVNGAGYSYSDVKTFTTGTLSVQTGSFMDNRDGKTYNTITLEDQTWMAENLTYLPEVCPSDTECGYWVYDYQGTDIAAAKATSYYTTYGVLYDWETSNDVCPTGWHLPSHEEWATFEINLGMSIDDAFYEEISAYRGTDEGGKMKETGTTHWLSPNTGATNISGFTALAGGQRYVQSSIFQYLGSNAYFWTSTSQGSGSSATITFRTLSNNSAHIGFSRWDPNPWKGNGYSVRCLQD